MRFPGKSAPAATASAGSSNHGNGSKFSFGVLGAMLVCAAAFLGIGAPAASAAPEAGSAWAYSTTFGESQNNTFDPARHQVALDSNGNVFAVELSVPGSTVIYTPTGEFLTTAGAFPPLDIAIDQSTDALYVSESPFFGGQGLIKRWLSDGQPTPTYTLDPTFEVPQGDGFAVDPTTGDIVVADPGVDGVRRYDETGSLVETISTSISPSWILAMGDGSFYVASASGPDLIHISGGGTVLGTIADVGQLEGLSYDPIRELIVASVGGQLKNYSLGGVLVSTSPSQGGGRGTAVAAAGQLYEENGSGSINVYSPAIKPGVEVPVVSELEAQSAHLEAEVDPGAGPPEGSVAHFEYSSDNGLTWTSTPDEAVERTGTDGPDTIEADITGLNLNSGYLVRVKASNAFWPSALSPTTSFGTLEIAPIVETGSVGDRSETGAMLYGTVNPAGLQTTYHFEYGTSTVYSSRVPLEAEAPVGNRRVPRTVQKPITGLQPGTTYHYRLVAENAIGETVGADRSFTTLKPEAVFPQRAYEQVTPVDKEGAVVQSDFHVQTAGDGSAIAVATAAASNDAESALIFQNYISRRGSSGWLDWTQADPPQDAVPRLNESGTAAISADFQHALVISNRVLAPGGIAGGGNLYVRDLSTGAYTFVAGAPGDDAWTALTGIQSNERIFLAGAPDFSWIMFWGTPQFLPEATGTAIYRWTRATDELKIESLLPDGSVPPFPVQIADGYQRELPSASSDGSVLAFGGGGVFRRENGQTTALSVSRVTGDANDDPQPASLNGMTPDGRYVFFQSPSQLTDDAPSANFATDSFYRYDAVTDQLIYLSPILAGTPLSFYGISDDGQRAYFDDGEKTVVWDDGNVRQVTTDRPANTLVRATTKVSPSGRYFAWEDENHVVNLYDAELDESSCASCPADGSSGGGARMMAIGRGIGNRAPRAVIEDGTVFFDTPVRLLAADHNGTKDVYEYKDGHLNLISPGDENFDATFIDASADGSSVFFQTAQGLVGRDTDGNIDVYVARVGGGFASQNPPPPPGSCQGAECAEAGGQPTVGPPVNTATAANPAVSQRKHKKHRHRKHKKSKKHNHKGQGHKSNRHGSKSLGR